MEGTNLALLLDELIVQILLRVPLASFQAVNCTCKYWRAILARREFWKFLAKSIWGEKSIPSSDVVANPTTTVAVVAGSHLIDWKEYFKIRTKLDPIVSIMNSLQVGFTPVDLDADLATKIETTSNNLRDNTLPDIDDDDAIRNLLKMVILCCDPLFSFYQLAIVWLEKLPTRYFQELAANKDLVREIVKITRYVLEHMPADATMLVLEFWSSSCDQEVDFRDLEGNGPDNSSQYVGSCCQDLVPLLIATISDEKYAATEREDWNARRSAETCLQLVVNVVLGDIVPLVEPMLHRDLRSEDWRKREVALTILGLLFTEQHYDYVEENAASYLLRVLDSLKFDNATVRASAAWAMNQICRIYADHVAAHNRLLSKAVLAALSDNDIHVRQHIFSCIANYNATDVSNPFEEDFSQLVAALLQHLVNPTDDDHVVYEALATFIDLQENIEPIKPLVPVILQHMQAQSHVVNVATSITRKLGKELLPYVDAFMTLYITQLHEEITEETLIAIGYSTGVAEDAFAKYLPTLMPIILPLLNNWQDTTKFISTVGLLVDICNYTKAAIQPYCHTIVQALLLALQNPAAERETKPGALELLGDIANAIGGSAYTVYLPHVLQVLQQAGVAMAQVDPFDEDAVGFLRDLQQAWFATWTNLFQTYSAYQPEELKAAVPFVLNTVFAYLSASINSSSAAPAILLVGDIIQCFGDEIKPFLAPFDQCLLLALNSNEEKVVAAAKWVRKLRG